MKVAQLKKILDRVDDDFEIELYFTTEIPSEELEGLSYPYPFKSELFNIEELRDIGFSDKKLALEIIKN